LFSPGPPPIKLTATIQLIVKSDVKHHKPNQINKKVVGLIKKLFKLKEIKNNNNRKKSCNKLTMQGQPIN
jgi:hypothetical protein